jgi:hypothetical protein
MIEERLPCCKMARPTERLVEVEIEFLTAVEHAERLTLVFFGTYA